jgi:outer membrane receptor protein involved in Fe transport
LAWFPALGDVLSVGAFYKRFESPIEVVNVPYGSTLLTTWSNADSADLYGVEFEARKNFDFFEDVFGIRREPGPTEDSRFIRFKDFNLVANFTIMDSQVSIPDKPPGDGPQFQFTNKNRALQGMSNYLVNVGFLFDSPRLGLTLNVLANSFGDRISAIGSGGLDDEKEEPRWNLEVTISKKIGKGTIKLTAENILDDPYEFKQSGITTREYRRGFAIGLAYSYSF